MVVDVVVVVVDGVVVVVVVVVSGGGGCGGGGTGMAIHTYRTYLPDSSTYSSTYYGVLEYVREYHV